MDYTENIPAPRTPVCITEPIDQFLTNSEVPVSQESRQESRLRQYGRTMRHGAELAIIGLEVSPWNEVMRYAPTAAVQVATGNTWAAAATLGTLNLVIEGGAAAAAADVLGSSNGVKATNWLNQKLEKVIKGRKVISNPVVEANLAFWGGAAVVLAGRQIENPHITRRERFRHGAFTVGWTSAALTGIYSVAGEGIKEIGPAPAVGVALGLGGLAAGVKLVRDRRKSRHHQTTEE